jgi:hypothetical protein
LPTGPFARKKKLDEVFLTYCDLNRDLAKVAYPVIPAKAVIQNSFKT